MEGVPPSPPSLQHRINIGVLEHEHRPHSLDDAEIYIFGFGPWDVISNSSYSRQNASLAGTFHTMNSGHALPISTQSEFRIPAFKSFSLTSNDEAVR
jgi:hypothetical protein